MNNWGPSLLQTAPSDIEAKRGKIFQVISIIIVLDAWFSMKIGPL